MVSLKSSDLQQIGVGSGGTKVYRVSKNLSGKQNSAVVKTPVKNTEEIKARFDKVKYGGIKTVSFMESCVVDGESALLMEDLFTDTFVYVSPNTVRNNDIDNEPEKYLLNNKIDSIANFEDLLQEMKTLYERSICEGIEINFDAVFFGVEKNNENPKVTYKIVDFDVMATAGFTVSELQTCNETEIRNVLSSFVEYFVSNSSNIASYKKSISSLSF